MLVGVAAVVASTACSGGSVEGPRVEKGETCSDVGARLKVVFVEWLDGERDTFYIATCVEAGDGGGRPSLAWEEVDEDEGEIEPGEIFLPLGRPLEVGETCEAVGQVGRDGIEHFLAFEDRFFTTGCAWQGWDKFPEVEWRTTATIAP